MSEWKHCITIVNHTGKPKTKSATGPDSTNACLLTLVWSTATSILNCALS